MSQPDVVLVTVDSLRADRCGYVSSERELTPNLDELASEGIAFTNAIAPGPKTPASIPAMFTGEFPVAPDDARAGESREFGRDTWRAIVSDHLERHTTIPEHLGDLGYSTYGISPNPFASRYSGYDALFDDLRDFFDEGEDQRVFTWLTEHASIPFLRSVVDWIRGERSFRSWESYADDGIARVNQSDDPCFLWLFSMDAHTPYVVSRSHRTENSFLDMARAMIALKQTDYDTRLEDPMHQRLVNAYDDAVAYTDQLIGYLVDELDDDTIVVITSDHGDAFFEHGSYYHLWNLYRENVHVPLVVANAGVTDEVDAPIDLRTLPDLMCALASGPGEVEAYLRDVQRSAAGCSKSLEAGSFAVQSEERKCVLGPDSIEVFDLERDPEEQEPNGDCWTSDLSTAASRRLGHHRERGEVEAAVADGKF